jgi:hypothetical protein
MRDKSLGLFMSKIVVFLLLRLTLPDNEESRQRIGFLCIPWYLGPDTDETKYIGHISSY